MKNVLKVVFAAVTLSTFASCAKDENTAANGSDTSMFAAVKNGQEAHLWVHVPKDNKNLQCWYYANVPASGSSTSDGIDLQKAKAEKILDSSQSITGNYAVAFGDVYKEIYGRVKSKNNTTKVNNSGVMVLWGDLVTQMTASRLIGNKDCISKSGGVAFLGSPSGNANTLQGRCRVEPLSSLQETKLGKVKDPKIQSEKDWTKLDALKFALSETKRSTKVCPGVAQLKAEFTTKK